MKIYFSIVILFLIISCSSKVTKTTDKTYDPLDENTPVVFMKGPPQIRNEEVCIVTYSVPEGFGYRSALSKEARKCGGNVLVLQSENLNDKNEIVYVAKVYKTFTDQVRINPEIVEKTKLAIKHNNIQSLDEILVKANVSTDPLFRSTEDSGSLLVILFAELINGANCNKKTVALLQDKYKVYSPVFYISDYYNKGARYSWQRVDLSKLEENSLYCDDYVESNFNNFEDRDKIALNFVDHFQKLIRYESHSDLFLLKLSQLNRVFRIIAKDVKSACQKDSTSDLCIMRSSFAEIEISLKSIFGEIAQNTPPIRKGKKKSTESTGRTLEEEIKEFEKTYNTFKI